MYCGNCGKEIENDSKFCPYCGGNCSDEDNTPQINNNINSDADKYQKLFIEPTEQHIASLGNSYLNSYLSSGKTKNCTAMLSNKRLYLYGTMYDSSSGSYLSRQRTEKVVNLEDITGTGFVYQEPSLWKLIVGIILILPLVTAIIGILLVLSYMRERESLFVVEYAGGYIKFDASIYGIAESQDFHRQIRRVQDNLKDRNK